MRLAFLGSPEFAAVHLRALIDSHHSVACVLTQPDRQKGRGRRVQASAVKQLATQEEIPVFQPASLRKPPDQLVAELEALELDLAVVVAYGLLLPSWILNLPRLGCLNVHASLLPRWRGAAPNFASILAGDTESGVTFMAMDEGLDTGGIYRLSECDISPRDTAGTLLDKIAAVSTAELTEVIDAIGDGLPATPQPDTGATYFGKVTSQQCVLDFASSAEQIERLVRAAQPSPGARIRLSYDDPQAILKVHAAKVVPHGDAVPAAPGEVIQCDKTGVTIRCSDAGLRLEQIQWPGGKIVDAAVLAQHPKWSERCKPGTKLPLLAEQA